MQEMKIDHNSPSFIGGWMISLALCDDIRDEYDEKFHLTTFDKKRGYHRLSDSDFNDKLMKRYVKQLNLVFDEYKKKFPWVDNEPNTIDWSVMSPFNVQKYEPEFNYKFPHIEDPGPREGKLIRNLTFATYLNDVEEAGETEFVYQKVKVKPKKGLTVIFPAGWTHPHFGRAAPNEIKYIITGWSSYHHRC
jgi:hypothetical protein